MEKFKKTIKLTVDIITNVLIVILIMLLMYVGYTRLILKDPASLTKTTSFYKVKTGSMKPTLNIGDYILVEKQDKYEVGDIITYKDNNSYTTHRITKINNEEIITKGDANNIEDENVTLLCNVKGKYIKKITKFGKIYEKIINKETIIITMLFVIILKIGVKLLIER